MEQDLRQRVVQLEAIMEAVPDSLAVYDHNGHVVLSNSAHRAQVARFISSSPGDTVTQRNAQVGGIFDEHGARLSQDQWPQSRVLQGQVLEGTDAVEFIVRNPNSADATFSVTGAPLRDDDGGVTGAVCVSRDITERKRLEREREEAQARELTVREVNQQLDQFFTTAAHDIRTPVSTTSGWLQMALLRFERLQAALAAGSGGVDKLLASTHESLVAADDSADRLARIVVRLFDVARARTGTLDLRLASCDLTALVRHHVAIERAATTGRTIHVEVPDHAVIVQADADRLGQVLDNYLSNALKYSADHQLVEVCLEVTEGTTVVSVRDHGPGLPWEEQRAVWEMFHRAPGVEVLSGTEGSLGLGLHICKRLIELHRCGRVGVESVVGEGSTFWYSLPLLSAESSDSPAT